MGRDSRMLHLNPVCECMASNTKNMGLRALSHRFIVAVAPSRDGQQASPSRGPPTVAPAIEPTTTRKVGASTPHRRPSASAEPSAPGTTGAPFQSRPSGL